MTWACSAQVHVSACGAGDAGYSGGTCYTSPLTLPTGAPAYLQNTRYGNFSYSFPLTDGSYNLTLHFIENSASGTTPTITAAGQRVFNVSANGAVVLPALDIFAAVGSNAPLDKSVPVTASGGAGITISFATVVRNAVVSGIDITPVAPPSNPFPGVTSDGANGLSIGGGITLAGGHAFSITWGGTTYVFPSGDGTGKNLHDSGVTDCAAAKVDPKAPPPCHLLVWQ